MTDNEEEQIPAYVVVIPRRWLESRFDKVIVLGSTLVLLVIVVLGILGTHSTSKAAPTTTMTADQQAQEYKAWTYDQWNANPTARYTWCQQDITEAQHALDHLSPDPTNQAVIQHVLRYLLNADCPAILNQGP